MRKIKIPEPLGHSKLKLHPSRRPEQRELDRALLALFGLAFRKIPGTKLHHLGGKEAS